MAFQSHQDTDKTPEQLAAQRARRLQQRIARALLKEDASGATAVDDAVRALRATVNDPNERRATRDHAAGLLLSNANRAAGGVPSVTFNQGVQLNASDLLRLVQPEPSFTTTGCSPALSPSAVPPLTPTSDLQDMHRLQEPVHADVIGNCGLVRSEFNLPLTDPTRCPGCHAHMDDEPTHACPAEGH